jgi:hypothetical protein
MQHAWDRSACKVLVGKPEGKLPLGSHKQKLRDIKMGLGKTRLESTAWIHLA